MITQNKSGKIFKNLGMNREFSQFLNNINAKASGIPKKRDKREDKILHWTFTNNLGVVNENDNLYIDEIECDILVEEKFS